MLLGIRGADSVEYLLPVRAMTPLRGLFGFSNSITADLEKTVGKGKTNLENSLLDLRPGIVDAAVEQPESHVLTHVKKCKVIAAIARFVEIWIYIQNKTLSRLSRNELTCSAPLIFQDCRLHPRCCGWIRYRRDFVDCDIRRAKNAYPTAFSLCFRDCRPLKLYEVTA